MAEFQVRTKVRGGNHRDKPRVYFCCHPDDFDKYFDRICEDIFKTHEPAIYYTADMSEPLDETNIEVDLEKMNLFVVPVTFRLLKEANRAMQVDIAVAKQKNIPILPFVMESGGEMDRLYSLEQNFGNRQYISPNSQDLTEISYEEKLKKHLEAVLLSDKTAKRVRAAFDAYVFLSYRKKDRAYANTLMRIIHSIPGCRDIAIWYDEFLTPGESFIQNIERAMEKSSLFTLLVTPNLLEEGNFVMTEEYPAAKRAGMDILPTEMVNTDHNLLSSRFDELPEPVKADDEHFSEALLSVIKKIAISENDNEPEHNFLIGLAYLDGIDVEVDVERGIELIKKAAEGGLREAINKLVDMYTYGYKVEADYKEALRWASFLYGTFLCVGFSLDYTYEEMLTARHKYALTLLLAGWFEKAMSVFEKLYDEEAQNLGEDHPDTISTLHNYATCCGKVGDKKKALELHIKLYDAECRLHGEEDPHTFIALSNLANAYAEVGDCQKALELFERVYKLQCEAYGEEHPYVSYSLGFIAGMHKKLGNPTKSLELYIETYELRKRVLGEDNIYTVHALYDVGLGYFDLKEYPKAVEIFLSAYEPMCRVIGEKTRDTVLCLNCIGCCYANMNDYARAAEYFEKVYSIFNEILGEDNSDTVGALYNLIHAYVKIGDYEKACVAQQIYCDFVINLAGEESGQAVRALYDLADYYFMAGENIKSIETYERLYGILKRLVGEDHEYSMNLLLMMGRPYYAIGDLRKAIELTEASYLWCVKNYGEEHPVTLARKTDLEFLLSKLK